MIRFQSKKLSNLAIGHGGFKISVFFLLASMQCDRYKHIISKSLISPRTGFRGDLFSPIGGHVVETSAGYIFNPEQDRGVTVAVRDYASATGMWFKQVTTRFFYKRTMKLMGRPFFQQHRKKIIIFGGLLWLVSGIAGFTFAKHHIDEHEQKIRSDVEKDFRSGRPYTNLLKQLDALSFDIKTALAAKDMTLLDQNVKRGMQESPHILRFDVLSPDDRTLISRGNGDRQSETTFVHRFHPSGWESPSTMNISTTIDLHIPEIGNAMTVLRSNTEYANEINGKIVIFLPTPYPSQKLKIKLFWVAWSFLATPAILIVGLLTLEAVWNWLEKRKKAIAAEKAAEQRLFILKCLREIIEPEADAKPEVEFGDYVLEDMIARGGMAELFIARKTGAHGFVKTVALKKILPHLADDEEFIQMFIQEAKKSARLEHANIVRTDDFGEVPQTDAFGKPSRAFYISMEYVRGKNLHEIMRATPKPLPVGLTCYIVLKMCEGLRYAHENGIIHRDVSPQNILISFEGDVKIADFGISKTTTDTLLTTQVGVIKGKLCYMAPEQILGQPVDHQTDIYSLGIVFYEMLCGERLYNVKCYEEASSLIPKSDITPITEKATGIAPQLNSIVMKCLSKDKNDRYGSVEKIIADLKRFRKTMNLLHEKWDLSVYMKTIFLNASDLQNQAIQPSWLWQFLLMMFSEKETENKAKTLTLF